MIGYMFQYKNDIIFSMSEKFDEVCFTEHRYNVLNYMCKHNTIDNILTWIDNLIFSLNKIQLMRIMSTLSYIKELRKIRNQFEITSDDSYELFDKFKSLRDKTITILYEDELLDNYYDEELLIKIRDNVNENIISNMLYNSKNEDIEKNVCCDLDYFNRYNYIDEIIDWSNNLIYCINKAQKTDEECESCERCESCESCERCEKECDEKCVIGPCNISCNGPCNIICNKECEKCEECERCEKERDDKLYMNLVDEFYDLNKKLSSINRRYCNIVHQLKRLQDEICSELKK